MKNYFSLAFLALLITFNSCSNGQTQNANTNLSPSEFSEKTKASPEVLILDVRTPEEFAGGHLENALNFNWNGNSFEQQIAGLDKSRPIYVYCLSGGRSAAAARKMRQEGFDEVYELDGGILKWRSAGLPEVQGNTSGNSAGMNMQDFRRTLQSDKLVLVDFYADWCVPCKKMEPYLREIATDMAGIVKVVRIDADKNPELCKQLHVEGLPVLHLYQDQKLIWNHTGFIDKAGVVEQLEK